MHEKRAHLAAIPPIPAILGGIVSVQAGAALAKGLFPALGPTGTVGLRVGVSAIMLLAAFWPQLGRVAAAQWQAVIPYGVVLGTMNIVFYLALSRIPLGVAVTVEFIGPLAVAVFGSRRAMDLAWVILAAVGIALLAPWAGGKADALGILLALAAGGCWAAYILLGGRVSRLIAGGAPVAMGMMIASFVALPVAVATSGFARLTPALSAAGIGVALKPRYFADVVSAWLVGIIINLLMTGTYFDIALRDLGLALGAAALGRLAQLYDRGVAGGLMATPK